MLKGHAKPILGLTYFVVVALLVTASIMAYRKALPWQAATLVTLSTTTPGLELNPQSDVKLQGVRVGEVRRITSDGRTAVVELALDNEMLHLIPANVDAAIVPKTLFGEKFVDLKVPAKPASARIAEGGVIRQSTTSVEIGALFSRLVPLLHSLRPEQLSTMLTSIAEALDGRGETFARSLNQLQAFLTEFEPHLGTLAHDIRQFARTADVYAESAPDLLRLLASSAAISSDLLVPKEERFATFLDRVVGTSEVTTDVLAENTERLVTLSGRARNVLALLDEFSSAIPCTLDGLRVFEKLINQAVGTHGPYANLAIDMVVARKPYKYPEDLPSNPNSDGHNSNLPEAIPGWAPHCPEFSAEVRALPPGVPYNQQQNTLPLKPTPATFPSGQSRQMDDLVAEATEALARATAARLLDVPQDEVPGYAGLLVSPLVSDGAVVAP
ncbi:MAG TPA: MCE family protein [Nocardioidaceae bacterium]|nr:MCE family protein [Nocardioidaceae bacterium]